MRPRLLVLRAHLQEAATLSPQQPDHELAADTNAWFDTWNENPTPFNWHKTRRTDPRPTRRLLRRQQPSGLRQPNNLTGR
jgi:hypothetical protein